MYFNRGSVTFAIISHPDAGKTTLTEKLLLYGGAIHEAGSVRARKASHHAARLDYFEKERYFGTLRLCASKRTV